MKNKLQPAIVLLALSLMIAGIFSVPARPQSNMGGGGSGTGGGSAYPITVSGATSGGIPCFTSATTQASSAAISAGVLIKGGGAGACVAASSITDSGSTIAATEQISASGGFTTGATVQAGLISNQTNGRAVFSGVAPTISSGFGGTPSIVAVNGTGAFTVNVGTGGSASSGVIGMPTATTGWSCAVAPNGAPQAAAVTYSTPTSTSSITLTNYTLTTGIALGWTASEVLQVSCWAY